MLRMWKLLTVVAICGHAVVAADAPNIVQNDNLGVKMHGDSLDAHMKLPAGGVADSGDVRTMAGCHGQG